MGEISTLFTEYSIEQLILLIIIVLFAVKALNEVIGFFYNKIRNYFGIENEKQKWEDNLIQALQEMKETIKDLDEQINALRKRQEETDLTILLIQERMQENSRSYLIDTHHKFYYEVGAIDELSLQSIERRYLYYKTANGDSFIDGLMNEIRELPHLNLYTGTIANKKIDDRKD